MKNKNDSSEKNTLLKVLSYTADRISDISDSNNVMGERTVVDGKTVIPISKISIGFAGGGADIISKHKKEGNPAGAGAKVDIIPMNYLVSDGKKIRVISAEPPQTPSVLSNLADSAFDKIRNLIAKKQAQK